MSTNIWPGVFFFPSLKRRKKILPLEQIDWSFCQAGHGHGNESSRHLLLRIRIIARQARRCPQDVNVGQDMLRTMFWPKCQVALKETTDQGSERMHVVRAIQTQGQALLRAGVGREDSSAKAVPIRASSANGSRCGAFR